MIVETRVLGKKGRPLDRWSVPPPPGAAGGGGLTPRDLITGGFTLPLGAAWVTGARS